jgi:hypothetical protein
VPAGTDHGVIGLDMLNALLGPILVEPPTVYAFDGAIERQHGVAVWKWLVRDVDPGLPNTAANALAADAAPELRARLSQKIADLIARARKSAGDDADRQRRLRVQLGEDVIYQRLDKIYNAFKYQRLLPQAVVFGRAINGVRDENALKLALNSFPVNDPVVSSLMMNAAIGEVKNPHRLISVVLSIAGSETQSAVEGAGFAPIVEALIAHAQNQLHIFADPYGKFADVDLACRALDRFYRLVLAIRNITECDKHCDWADKTSGLVRQMSQVIEPRLARVESDIRIALRKPRSGPDRLDPELLLEALNGMYLLIAVREARESLALNSLFSTVWAGTGKDLEVLISRNLDALRADPGNDIVAKRLNTGIKLAEIRFNPEYADILKRAKDGAGRLGD